MEYLQIIEVIPMTDTRNGEQGPLPNRSDRIFQKNGYFYYHTREGIDIGPFDTLKDARRGVDDFLSYMKTEPGSSATLLQYASRVA
jgi:hypothetical protein